MVNLSASKAAVVLMLCTAPLLASAQMSSGDSRSSDAQPNCRELRKERNELLGIGEDQSARAGESSSEELTPEERERLQQLKARLKECQ